MKKPVISDPKEEALKRLETAIRIFDEGMKKEACPEVSNAVRVYFKGTFQFYIFSSSINP